MVFSCSCSWFVFRFVSCYWWLMHLLISFFFSPSSFKRVQFLEEKLSLSHLHFLCHTCFYPGWFLSWFLPHVVFCFTVVSAPCFDSIWQYSVCMWVLYLGVIEALLFCTPTSHSAFSSANSAPSYSMASVLRWADAQIPRMIILWEP